MKSNSLQVRYEAIDLHGTNTLFYLTKGEAIWQNLSVILAERNISWIELTRKMFAGEFHYPSELNRLYQKIRHYKMEQRMPQSPWVERIVQVLDLDYEDLFRR